MEAEKAAAAERLREAEEAAERALAEAQGKAEAEMEAEKARAGRRSELSNTLLHPLFSEWVLNAWFFPSPSHLCLPTGVRARRARGCAPRRRGGARGGGGVVP